MFPEFWDTLQNEVLPHFPADVSIHSIRRGHKDRGLASIEPSFSAWIKRFHIQTVAWLHRIALEHLRTWAENPTAARGFLGFGSQLEYSEEICFCWEPKLETAAAFLSRVERQVRALSASAAKCPLPLSDAHAEWLCLYQFRGLSPGDIQKWVTKNRDDSRGTTEDASVIRKGYTSAAKRLGIQPRPPKRGPSRRK